MVKVKVMHILTDDCSAGRHGWSACCLRAQLRRSTIAMVCYCRRSVSCDGLRVLRLSASRLLVIYAFAGGGDIADR